MTIFPLDNRIAGGVLAQLYDGFEGPSSSFFSALLDQPYCRAWHLLHEEASVGAVWYQCSSDRAEMVDLRVHANSRRCGYGQVLLLGTLAELSASGVNLIDLEVKASNQAARGLYEKVGFQSTGRRRDYYRAATGYEDAILMSLSLPLQGVQQ